MKPLFNNWRKYLKESLLKEFKKSDAEAVLEDEDSFTVSYEIEIVSEDYVGLEDEDEGGYGGMPDEYNEQYAVQRRRYASEFLPDSYFDEQVRNGESEMLWLELFDDDSDPDLEDLMGLYFEEKTAVGGSQERYAFEVAQLDFALDQIKGKFSEILKKLTTPGTKENKIFLQFLKNHPEIARDLEDRDTTDLTDKQQTIPGVSLESEVAKEAFRRYVYDYENRSLPYGVGYGPLVSLFGLLESIDEEEFVEDLEWEVNLEYERVINPGGRYTTLNDLTSIDRQKSPFYNNLAKFIEEKAEAFIERFAEERRSEYEEDPEDYLHDIGYDLDSAFENWWENNWENFVESRGEGGEENARRLLEEYLPNFYSKYEDIIKIVPDASLPSNYNMEIVIDDPPTYLNGLDAGLEYMETFFNDFDKQNNFKFTRGTGLHTNIGYKVPQEGGDKKLTNKYNLIKSLLFLNHEFALKNFENRKGSRWAGDLKADALKAVKMHITDSRGTEDTMAQWLSKNFEEFEKIINGVVFNYADSLYSKGIGFNILYTKRRGYIEFRYPGNIDPTYEGIRDATLYYAHVVKAGADEEYKKEEYLKKLTGFVENAKAATRTEITDFPRIRELVKEHKGMPIQQRLPDEKAPGPFYKSYKEIGGKEIPMSLQDVIFRYQYFWIKGIERGDSIEDTVVVLETLEDKGQGPEKTEIRYPIIELERDLVNSVVSKTWNKEIEELARGIYDKTGTTVSEAKKSHSKIEEMVLKAVSKKMFNF